MSDSLLYKDIHIGREVHFKFKPSGKKKRVRTEEDPFAPISRTEGTGTVIFAGPHIITIRMPDGYKVTLERVEIVNTKTAVVHDARPAPVPRLEPVFVGGR